MSNETAKTSVHIPFRKMMPVILITWALSLITTLVAVYYAPSIFPPISSEKIGDSAILTTKLADGSITSAKILDGTISAVDIVDGSLISVKIADGAVTATKIADSSVDTNKIADNAIITVKLGDNSVTSAKVVDGAITTVDLSDGSITETKIADGAITTSKIADGAITGAKLAGQAIPFSSAWSNESTTTTETMQLVDASGLSLNIVLNRTSHLLILLSTEAFSSSDERILVQCLVDDEVAHPGIIYLTPVLFPDSGSVMHGYAVYSYNFYMPSVALGTHTVKIQWRVTGGTGYMAFRTITAIGLPA